LETRFHFRNTAIVVLGTEIAQPV